MKTYESSKLKWKWIWKWEWKWAFEFRATVPMQQCFRWIGVLPQWSESSSLHFISSSLCFSSVNFHLYRQITIDQVGFWVNEVKRRESASFHFTSSWLHFSFIQWTWHFTETLLCNGANSYDSAAHAPHVEKFASLCVSKQAKMEWKWISFSQYENEFHFHCMKMKIVCKRKWKLISFSYYENENENELFENLVWKMKMKWEIFQNAKPWVQPTKWLFLKVLLERQVVAKIEGLIGLTELITNEHMETI